MFSALSGLEEDSTDTQVLTTDLLAFIGANSSPKNMHAVSAPTLRPYHLFRLASDRLIRTIETSETSSEVLAAIDALCELPSLLDRGSGNDDDDDSLAQFQLGPSSFTTMINACRRLNPPQVARSVRLLKDMRKFTGLEPSRLTYEAVLAVAVKAGDRAAAVQVYREAEIFPKIVEMASATTTATTGAAESGRKGSAEGGHRRSSVSLDLRGGLSNHHRRNNNLPSVVCTAGFWTALADLTDIYMDQTNTDMQEEEKSRRGISPSSFPLSSATTAAAACASSPYSSCPHSLLVFSSQRRTVSDLVKKLTPPLRATTSAIRAEGGGNKTVGFVSAIDGKDLALWAGKQRIARGSANN